MKCSHTHIWDVTGSTGQWQMETDTLMAKLTQVMDTWAAAKESTVRIWSHGYQSLRKIIEKNFANERELDVIEFYSLASQMVGKLKISAPTPLRTGH